MQHIQKRKAGQEGFTLIEIIAVIAIIGILAAIAIPKFIDLSSEAKKAAADGTLTAMQSATALAFAKHRAEGLTQSGTETMKKYIVDYTTLGGYLDGGYPDGVTQGEAATNVVLQDGRVVTITPETTTSRATLSVSG